MDDERDKRRAKKMMGNESMVAMEDMISDPDADEALNDLDEFLASEGGEGAGEARSGADGSEWGELNEKGGYTCILTPGWILGSFRIWVFTFGRPVDS